MNEETTFFGVKITTDVVSAIRYSLMNAADFMWTQDDGKILVVKYKDVVESVKKLNAQIGLNEKPVFKAKVSHDMISCPWCGYSSSVIMKWQDWLPDEEGYEDAQTVCEKCDRDFWISGDRRVEYTFTMRYKPGNMWEDEE